MKMFVFMHKYIKRNVDVKGDGNCDYPAVSVVLDRGKEKYRLVFQQLLKELKTRKKSYVIYEKKHFDAFHESLIPCISGLTPKKKWMCFPEIGAYANCI